MIKDELQSIKNKHKDILRINKKLVEALEKTVKYVTPIMENVKKHTEKNLHGVSDHYGQNCASTYWEYFVRIEIKKITEEAKLLMKDAVEDNKEEPTQHEATVEPFIPLSVRRAHRWFYGQRG